MSRTATLIVIGLLVVGAALAAITLLGSGSRRGTARIMRPREQDREAVFIARFDSLTDVRLLPTVWRSGSFLSTAFDEKREEWRLAISRRDWSLRDEESKRDLAAVLVSTFEAVRAQAGGDPDRAELVIENEEGEVLLRATQESGIILLK